MKRDAEHEKNKKHEHDCLLDVILINQEEWSILSNQFSSHFVKYSPSKSATMKSCLKTEHSPSHDRTIRFSSIRIREYPYELSHNPSVSAGVPISIGWEHESEYSVDIENYDSTLRKKSGSKRPCPNILDVSTRSSM